MGLFGAAYGWWGQKALPPPSPTPLTKACHRNPAMMKLDTVIPYLMKIQKIYESGYTLLEFFRNQQILLYQEIQI